MFASKRFKLTFPFGVRTAYVTIMWSNRASLAVGGGWWAVGVGWGVRTYIMIRYAIQLIRLDEVYGTAVSGKSTSDQWRRDVNRSRDDVDARVLVGRERGRKYSGAVRKFSNRVINWCVHDINHRTPARLTQRCIYFYVYEHT